MKRRREVPDEFGDSARARIRLYRANDRGVLESFMDAFQDELAVMDDLGRLWRAPRYGQAAAEECLREAREQRGQILIAELDGQPVGFAAGIIGDVAPFDRLTARVGLYGRVTELYVAPAARRRGIAKRLLARLDRCFIRAGCDTVRIDVFAPNQTAGVSTGSWATASATSSSSDRSRRQSSRESRRARLIRTRRSRSVAVPKYLRST